jgi:small subunit ribosomal protein S6
MSVKLRTYELIYLVNRDASDEDREQFQGRLASVVTDQFSGKVLKFESWGKRRLAYEIKKGLDTYIKAYYQYFVFQAEPGANLELERIMRLNDQCIRFLNIKLDKFDPSIQGVDLSVAEEAPAAPPAKAAPAAPPAKAAPATQEAKEA